MLNVPFYRPDFSTEESNNASDVIKSRWVASGPMVKKFENAIARMSDSVRAVAFDSCTAAMEMSLRALGIGPGDEVITTPYTYTATAEVIRNVGAKIVFVDLAKDSFEMDYSKVEEAITERTKAIIPVDIGGKLCDYHSLYYAIGKRYDSFRPNNEIQDALGHVAVIADAAHSFGAEMEGMRSGYWADFTCFSFHVVKPITTGGEGGAVVWKDIPRIDNGKLEKTFRLLGDHGQTSRNKENGWEYDIELFGFNHIMTDVDAAVGLGQLVRLPDIDEKRLQMTKKYDELFAGKEFCTPMIKHIGRNYKSSKHLYPVRLNTRHGDEADRNKVFSFLKEHGISCNVHYKPLPMMTAYKNIGFDIKDYPNAYDMFKSILTIPYFSGITEEQQEYVVETIGKAVETT